MVRRLPVYILLDCSESMVGEGLAAARRGIASIFVTSSRSPAPVVVDSTFSGIFAS